MNQPAIKQDAPTFEIVEKGVTLDIKDKAGRAFTNLYIGAGWDMDGAAVDLDLVAACLSGGKLVNQERLVYFANKKNPGLQLSADNTTGEGDGDDESIVIDLAQVASDVDSIAVGVAAYAGADLSSAKNVHFRAVNGTTAEQEQVFSVPMSAATRGDTVLHAFNLKRSPTGWRIENISAFHKKGTGTDAIKGFAQLFA